MKVGTDKGKRYRPYKRMSDEEKEMIFKLYEEKMELRKIARILGRSLSLIQYQLRKKMKEYKDWSVVGGIKTGRKFYFLSKKKNIDSLLLFNFDLPKVERYYTDVHFAYSNVYGDKASQKKLKYTNLVENLNSQMRDKISYLVRKTKVHAKSFKWLNQKLAMFFVELNLKGLKIAI